MTNDDLKRAVTKMIEPVASRKFNVVIDRDGQLVAVIVRPAPIDVARLIGRGGENFQALGGILSHAGEKAGLSVRYFIRDPEPTNERPPFTPPNPAFNPNTVRDVAKTALKLAGYQTETLVVEREGRHVIAVAAVLPYKFRQALERWLTVCAKTQGGVVSLDAERVPS